MKRKVESLRSNPDRSTERVYKKQERSSSTAREINQTPANTNTGSASARDASVYDKEIERVKALGEQRIASILGASKREDGGTECQGGGDRREGEAEAAPSVIQSTVDQRCAAENAAANPIEIGRPREAEMNRRRATVMDGSMCQPEVRIMEPAEATGPGPMADAEITSVKSQSGIDSLFMDRAKNNTFLYTAEEEGRVYERGKGMNKIAFRLRCDCLFATPFDAPFVVQSLNGLQYYLSSAVFRFNSVSAVCISHKFSVVI